MQIQKVFYILDLCFAIFNKFIYVLAIDVNNRLYFYRFLQTHFFFVFKNLVFLF